MDDMTKQDIAARMAKAAIELDRLEKEKKETVREYNEQINDVQDQIISLARQYEDNTPNLFDPPVEDDIQLSDVEEVPQEAGFLPRLLSMGEVTQPEPGEPEIDPDLILPEPRYVQDAEYTFEDALSSVPEPGEEPDFGTQLAYTAKVGEYVIETIFGSYQNPALDEGMEEFRWSVKNFRNVLISRTMLYRMTDRGASEFSLYPKYLDILKDDLLTLIIASKNPEEKEALYITYKHFQLKKNKVSKYLEAVEPNNNIPFEPEKKRKRRVKRGAL